MGTLSFCWKMTKYSKISKQQQQENIISKTKFLQQKLFSFVSSIEKYQTRNNIFEEFSCKYLFIFFFPLSFEYFVKYSSKYLICKMYQNILKNNYDLYLFQTVTHMNLMMNLPFFGPVGNRTRVRLSVGRDGAPDPTLV